MDYITVTSLTDPIERRIPVGEAHEWFSGGVLRIELRKPDERQADPDPNVAMIARDEPAQAIRACGGAEAYRALIDWGVESAVRPSIFDRLRSDAISRVKIGFSNNHTAKPAIHGITTVHDGRPRGIGFCEE